MNIRDAIAEVDAAKATIHRNPFEPIPTISFAAAERLYRVAKMAMETETNFPSTVDDIHRRLAEICTEASVEMDDLLDRWADEAGPTLPKIESERAR